MYLDDTGSRTTEQLLEEAKSELLAAPCRSGDFAVVSSTSCTAIKKRSSLGRKRSSGSSSPRGSRPQPTLSVLLLCNGLVHCLPLFTTLQGISLQKPSSGATLVFWQISALLEYYSEGQPGAAELPCPIQLPARWLQSHGSGSLSSETVPSATPTQQLGPQLPPRKEELIQDLLDDLQVIDRLSLLSPWFFSREKTMTTACLSLIDRKPGKFAILQNKHATTSCIATLLVLTQQAVIEHLPLGFCPQRREVFLADGNKGFSCVSELVSYYREPSAYFPVPLEVCWD